MSRLPIPRPYRKPPVISQVTPSTRIPFVLQDSNPTRLPCDDPPLTLWSEPLWRLEETDYSRTTPRVESRRLTADEDSSGKGDLDGEVFGGESRSRVPPTILRRQGRCELPTHTLAPTLVL